MDVTKIFAMLCGFLLIICLTLSITCLVVMRNAVEETSVWQGRAEALVNELDGCVEAMKNIENEDLPVLAPNEDEKTDDGAGDGGKRALSRAGRSKGRALQGRSGKRSRKR